MGVEDDCVVTAGLEVGGLAPGSEIRLQLRPGLITSRHARKTECSNQHYLLLSISFTIVKWSKSSDGYFENVCSVLWINIILN